MKQEMQEEEEAPPPPGSRMAAVFETVCSLSCCSDFLAPRNRVLPHGLEPLGEAGVQYVEPSLGRRLRVLCVKPSNPPSSDSVDVKKDSKAEDEGELSEEEYWFESAAPNRLPVIQPVPPPPQSRIINKFEPREPSSASIVGSPPTKIGSPGDCISPGRLPRKKLGSRVLEEEDDYEDEETVSTGNDLVTTSSSPSPATSPRALSMLGPVSNMILEITADSTTRLDQATRIQVSPSPPPRSPDPLADDSCHPSPEVPHRTVCASPDPDGSDPPSLVDTTNVKVMGGNLGGMANQGFSPDDDDEEIMEPEESTSDTETLPADEIEVDTGYSTNGDTLDTLDSIAPLPAPAPPPTSTNPSPEGESTVTDGLPILFFLHGVGGSADIWSNQLGHFSSLGYTCVAPDMLGHGFSACPDSAKAYTFSRLFKDILAIFDAFVPEERRAVVFGHSYGCSFSVALARTRPERICTMVLVAGGGPTPLAPPPDTPPQPGLKWVMAMLRRLLECKARGSQQKYNPRGKSLRFREAYDVPGYVFQHVMTGQVWPEGDAGFHRRVVVPTLLVYGMRDCLVSLVEECEMERTLPKAFLELVPGAGHAVMLDTPDILNTMTERFVKKWTRGSTH